MVLHSRQSAFRGEVSTFLTNTNLQAGLERKLQLTALDNNVRKIQQMDLSHNKLTISLNKPLNTRW